MAGRGLGQLFARKSVEQMHAENESGELKKSLGAINLVLLGIGCIIGTGIFVLTGRAAAEFAGPGIMISFVITGTLCALVAICYSELAAAIPVSGSAYSYSYASLGEFVAWIMGVLLLLEYGVAASTVAVGWSGYTTSLLHDLGINLPHALTQAPGVLVATSGIDVMAIDPQVALAGATGVLADGTQVVFDKTAQAVLAGQFPIQVSDYSVVADRLLEVGSANSATLIDGVKATLHTVTEGAATTQQTVDVAANATITFLENSKVSLPSEAIAALAPGQTVGSMVNLPALMGILAVTALLTLGVSESANVNNIVVVIKVTVVVAFIVIGFFYVNPANWSPLIPDQVPAPPPGSDMSVGGQIWSALGNIITGQSRDSAYGVGGLIAAASTIFFAYIGFEAVSTAGAEAKNPARDMPIGIIGSLVICTILYILTCAVLVGIVPYYELNDPAPIAKAVNQIGLPWFAFLVKVGAFAGLSSVMLVLLYGQTRIFYTMARDGLLPSVFAKINPKTQTPVLNTIVVGVIAAGFAGFTGLDFLGDTTNVGTLVAFMLICVTVVYLRFARPNMNRPFKMPTWAITIIAVLGATMCFVLVMSLMSSEQTRNFFIPYLIVGILFYFGYGMWHSKLAKGVVVIGHEANPDLESKGLTDVEPPFKN
jgi:APA family basic amino acid/polyamine antiporter